MSLQDDLKRFSRDLAEVHFTIWGIPPDDRDIKDGEFPINDRLAIVRGFEAAFGAAQGALATDPQLSGVFIVPNIRLDPGRYFSRLHIGRAAGQDMNLPHLDPNEGDGPRKGTIIP